MSVIPQTIKLDNTIGLLSKDHEFFPIDVKTCNQRFWHPVKKNL